jgi:hypothetical protein
MDSLVDMNDYETIIIVYAYEWFDIEFPYSIDDIDPYHVQQVKDRLGLNNITKIVK